MNSYACVAFDTSNRRTAPDQRSDTLKTICMNIVILAVPIL